MSEVLGTELEKIDILRERMGLSYEEARMALEGAQGDVIQALANKEKEMEESMNKEEAVGEQLWEGIKQQMSRLNQTQVKLKREDKTVLSVSAPLGIAMAYTLWRRPGLRLLSLLGVAGAAMKNYELELDSMEDPVEYVSYPIMDAETGVSSESHPQM